MSEFYPLYQHPFNAHVSTYIERVLLPHKFDNELWLYLDTVLTAGKSVESVCLMLHPGLGRSLRNACGFWQMLDSELETYQNQLFDMLAEAKLPAPDAAYRQPHADHLSHLLLLFIMHQRHIKNKEAST